MGTVGVGGTTGFLLKARGATANGAIDKDSSWSLTFERSTATATLFLD